MGYVTKIINPEQSIPGLQPGKDQYSEGTFDCDQYKGCIYNNNGRCVFNVSSIQQKMSKACYHDDKLCDWDYYN